MGGMCGRGLSALGQIRPARVAICPRADTRRLILGTDTYGFRRLARQRCVGAHRGDSMKMACAVLGKMVEPQAVCSVFLNAKADRQKRWNRHGRAQCARGV